MGPDSRTLLTPGLRRGAAIVAAVTCLGFLPGSCTHLVRDAWRLVLRPGCYVVETLRGRAAGLLDLDTDSPTLADENRRLQDRVAELADENHRLRDELLGIRAAAGRSDPSAAPLLAAALVPARVLGSQSRAYAVDRLLVEIGGEANDEDLVLVPGGPAEIDLGAKSGAQLGALALSGSVVWGKLCDVGRHTSVVRRVTDRGYRDLVFIAPPNADLRGPQVQGVWQGDGGTLARIGQVDASAAVQVGDRVYSAAAVGAVEGPLPCGEIVRVERGEGSHWVITARPLTPGGVPAQLDVLTIRPNAHRMASAEE